MVRREEPIWVLFHSSKMQSCVEGECIKALGSSQCSCQPAVWNGQVTSSSFAFWSVSIGSSFSSDLCTSTKDALDTLKMPWTFTRTLTFTFELEPSDCGVTFWTENWAGDLRKDSRECTVRLNLNFHIHNHRITTRLPSYDHTQLSPSSHTQLTLATTLRTQMSPAGFPFSSCICCARK